MPTYEIKGLVGSQDGTYFHWSVPTSLNYLLTNLYTSVVDFIYVRRLVESALYASVWPFPKRSSGYGPLTKIRYGLVIDG